MSMNYPKNFGYTWGRSVYTSTITKYFQDFSGFLKLHSQFLLKNTKKTIFFVISKVFLGSNFENIPNSLLFTVNVLILQLLLHISMIFQDF